MRYATVFDAIHAAFEKAGINYLLIGGFAINAYQFARQTNDIDFLICADDFKKLDPCLSGVGFEKKQVAELYAWYEGIDFPFDVDVLFVDKKTLELMEQEGKHVKIAGHSFTVPSLTHLIAMKLHAIKNNPGKRKDKDLKDILELVQIHGLDVTSREFETDCRKFGPEGIYEEIIKKIKH